MHKKLKAAIATLLLFSSTLCIPIQVKADTDIGAGGSSFSGSTTTQAGNNPNWSITQYITDRPAYPSSATSSNCIIGAHVTPMYCSRADYDSALNRAGGDKKRAVDDLLTAGKFINLFNKSNVFIAGNSGNIGSFYLYNGGNHMPTAIYTYNPNAGMGADFYSGWIRNMGSYNVLLGSFADSSQLSLDLSSRLSAYGANSIFSPDIFYAATSGRDQNLYFYGSDHADNLPSSAVSAFEKMSNAALNNTLGGNFRSVSDCVLLWFVEPILSTEINLEKGNNDHWQPYGLTPVLMSQAVDVVGSSGLGDMYNTGSSVNFVNFCHSNGYTTDYSLEGVNGAGAYCVLLGDEGLEYRDQLPEIPSIPIFYKDTNSGALTYSGSSSTIPKEEWNKISAVLLYGMGLSDTKPSDMLGTDMHIEAMRNKSSQAKNADGSYNSDYSSAYNSVWSRICFHYSSTDMTLGLTSASVPKRTSTNQPNNVTSIPGDSDGPFNVDTSLGGISASPKNLTYKSGKAQYYAISPDNSSIDIVRTESPNISNPYGTSVSIGSVLKNPYEYAIVVEKNTGLSADDDNPEPPNIVIYDEESKTVWNASIPKQDYYEYTQTMKYARGLYPDVTNELSIAQAETSHKLWSELMNLGSGVDGWDNTARAYDTKSQGEDSADYFTAMSKEYQHWKEVKEADDKLVSDLNDYMNNLNDALSNCVYHYYNDDIWHEFDNAILIHYDEYTHSYYNWESRNILGLNNKYKHSIFKNVESSSDNYIASCERYENYNKTEGLIESWKDYYETYMHNNFYNVYSEKTFALSHGKTMYTNDSVRCVFDCDVHGDHVKTVNVYNGDTYQNMSNTDRRPFDEDNNPINYNYYATASDGGYSCSEYVWGSTEQSEEKSYSWCVRYDKGDGLRDNGNDMPCEYLGWWGLDKDCVSVKFAEVQVNAYNDLKGQVENEINTIQARMDVLKNRMTAYEMKLSEYNQALAVAEEAIVASYSDKDLVTCIITDGVAYNDLTEDLLRRTNDDSDSSPTRTYSAWKSDKYHYNRVYLKNENTDDKEALFNDAGNPSDILYSSYKNDASDPPTKYKLTQVSDTSMHNILESLIWGDESNPRIKLSTRYRVVYTKDGTNGKPDPTIRMSGNPADGSESIQSHQNDNTCFLRLTYEMVLRAPYSYGIIINSTERKTNINTEIPEYQIDTHRVFNSPDHYDIDTLITTVKKVTNSTYTPENNTYIDIITHQRTNIPDVPHNVTAHISKTPSDLHYFQDTPKPVDTYNNVSSPSPLPSYLSSKTSSYSIAFLTPETNETKADLFFNMAWLDKTDNTVKTSVSEMMNSLLTEHSYRESSSGGSIDVIEHIDYDSSSGTRFDFSRTQGSLSVKTIYAMSQNVDGITNTIDRSNAPQPFSPSGAVNSYINCGYKRVWATNPDNKDFFMPYEVKFDYTPSIKITSMFSTDNQDITSMEGRDSSNSVPYIKAGQTFEGEISNNVLIIDAYCNVASDDDFVADKNLKYNYKDNFITHMDNVVEYLKNCSFGIVSTIPEFNVNTNATVSSTKDFIGVHYNKAEDIGKVDNDASLSFDSTSELVPAHVNYHRVNSTNSTYIYNTSLQFNATSALKTFGLMETNKYFTDSQDMYDNALARGTGTGSWYWEYSDGMAYVHYHAEIYYGNGKFTAVVSKYASDSRDDAISGVDAYLRDGSDKNKDRISNFEHFFGYDTTYRRMDGDNYILAPYIDMKYVSSNADAYEVFSNGYTITGILGAQTPIHVRGNIYDNT